MTAAGVADDRYVRCGRMRLCLFGRAALAIDSLPVRPENTST